MTVVLVAIHVDDSANAKKATREEAMTAVAAMLDRDAALETLGEGHDRTEISWWVAEDDRSDGSDCDSAVFVEPGNQAIASLLLHAARLTPANNVVAREMAVESWKPDERHFVIAAIDPPTEDDDTSIVEIVDDVAKVVWAGIEHAPYDDGRVVVTATTALRVIDGEAT